MLNSLFSPLTVDLRAQLANLTRVAKTPLGPEEMYDLLMAYYLNNGLYDDLAKRQYDQARWMPAMKALRNPAYRVVQFYVAKLWPGQLPRALPIEAAKSEIIQPIHQVWEWSNWDARKQVAVKWLAIYGDLFVKVVQREDKSRVFFQLIEPKYVSDFDTDERGFLTYIRIDTPQNRRERDRLISFTHTEVWDKEQLRIWEHEKGAVDIRELGTPKQSVPLKALGINFVPVVHIKLRDIGEDRGVGAFTHALDKIDEANILATRLHQMVFRYNKPLWALAANQVDAMGRPLPAPRVAGAEQGADSDTFDFGDDRLVRLPGNSSLQSMVPNINYAAALEILNAHMIELEKDMPELAYYRLRDMGNISGRAARMLLSDATDLLLEARGNAEAGLARADAMALTIGANAGLFSGIGSYEAGDFGHSFIERPVIAIPKSEEAAGQLQEAQAALLWQQLGVSLPTVQERMGFDPARERLLNEATTPEMVDQLLAAFDKGD